MQVRDKVETVESGKRGKYKVLQRWFEDFSVS